MANSGSRLHGVCKKCQACRSHANFIHPPPEALHLMASWPFAAWGLNVVGPLTPKLTAVHAYVLATTYYFLKLDQDVPLREVKKKNLVEFIKNNLILSLWCSKYIIIDAGNPFYSRLTDKLCKSFGFKQYNSSMYNAQLLSLLRPLTKPYAVCLRKS